MERASRELVAMDYLACEADCLEALGLARAEGDFTAYRRVLRPLQEARRARRMLAADAAVWIGPPPPEAEDGASQPARVIASGAGCCCVSNGPAAATARLARAREEALHAEVLVGEPVAEDPTRWAVAAPPAAGGPADRGLFPTGVAAPPEAMLGVALHPDDAAAGGGITPRHWFIEASEAVGDAALAWASSVAPAATLERLAGLETAVAAVGDHELLHQALADTAAALELSGGGLR